MPDGGAFEPPWRPSEDLKLAEAMRLNQERDAGFGASFALPGLGASLSRRQPDGDDAAEYVDQLLAYMNGANRPSRSPKAVLQRLSQLRDAYHTSEADFLRFEREARKAITPPRGR